MLEWSSRLTPRTSTVKFDWSRSFHSFAPGTAWGSQRFPSKSSKIRVVSCCRRWTFHRRLWSRLWSVLCSSRLSGKRARRSRCWKEGSIGRWRRWKSFSIWLQSFRRRSPVKNWWRTLPEINTLWWDWIQSLQFYHSSGRNRWCEQQNDEKPHCTARHGMLPNEIRWSKPRCNRVVCNYAGKLSQITK